VCATGHSSNKLCGLRQCESISCDSHNKYESLGLNGAVIESRWRHEFPNMSKPALGPIHPYVQWVPCHSFC